MMKAPTSGRGPRPRQGTGTWAQQVAALCDEVDVACTCELRPTQAGKPSILRLRARDEDGRAAGGTAVLTLYATGSWTWGGDSETVAYAREPLERHGLLASM